MNFIRHYFFLFLIGSIAFTISCTNEHIETIDCEISGPSIELSNVVNAGCDPSGSLTVNATGGEGELMFSIDGVEFQTSPTFNDLSSGTFIVTVVDENGCTATVNAAVGNDDNDLSFLAETTTGGCETNEGTITVTASGGAGGYTYRVGTGTFQESNIFEGISGGAYTVTIKDAEGCVTSQRINVSSGVSYASQIKPIIDTNCNVTLCHGSDPVLPDWSSYSTVKNNASSIKSSTQNGTMPPEEKLTQNQIDLIACWVDDGAPNN